MLPAFSVVTYPSVHMTSIEILVSVLFGMLLSIPLIYTTQYEVREDGKIYAKKSLGFVVALILIFVIRRIVNSLFPGIDALTLNALSIISLFVYVGLWRVVSFNKFRKVYNSLITTSYKGS